MKILVIGNRGSMGSRYTAILKYLGHEVIGYDTKTDPIAMFSTMDFDKAIIASPTSAHFEDAMELATIKKDFLCEKPLSKYPEEIMVLLNKCCSKGVRGNVVCNYAYADNTVLGPGMHDISWNYYNHGQDSLLWDCCQLVYLSNGMPELSTTSPIFNMTIDGSKITLDDISRSYVTMIEYWIADPDLLWSLEDAYKMTKKVIG